MCLQCLTLQHCTLCSYVGLDIVPAKVGLGLGWWDCRGCRNPIMGCSTPPLANFMNSQFSRKFIGTVLRRILKMLHFYHIDEKNSWTYPAIRPILFSLCTLSGEPPLNGHFYESQIVRGKREVEILVTLPAPFAAGGVINKQALQCGTYMYIYIYIRSSMSPITYSKEPARGGV